LQIINVYFEVREQLLVTCIAYVKYYKEVGIQWDRKQLFRDFQKAYDP